MAEQSGNRIPKTPSSPAWEGQEGSTGGDPTSGNMGGGWMSGGAGGDPTSGEIAKPNPGGTFSGSK